MIEIKHELTSIEEKYKLLENHNLLHFLDCTNILEFQTIINQTPEKLSILKKYMPVIFTTDPAIKQLSKITNKIISNEIVKIRRPDIDDIDKEEIYYRLIING